MRHFDVKYEKTDGVYRWVTAIPARNKHEAEVSGRSSLRKIEGDREKDYRAVLIERAKT